MKISIDTGCLPWAHLMEVPFPHHPQTLTQDVDQQESQDDALQAEHRPADPTSTQLPSMEQTPVFLIASRALFQHRLPSELCLVWEQQEEQQLSTVSRRFSEL